MKWENTLAQHFKDRDNPDMIGSTIGTVISVKPFKVSILEGSVIIDGTMCYVGRYLKELIKESTEYNIKSDMEIQPYSVNATFNGTSGTLNITETKTDYKAKIKREDVLKVGDKVLVIASESNNFYYIVDKLEEVE